MPAHRIDVTDRVTRSVVVCADDYAVHASATAGILALAHARRVSATSVMVLSPRWAADAAPLRECREWLDVGLHLDFTSSFAGAAGVGRSLAGMMGRTLWPLGASLRTHWRDAIERQCDAFEQHWQDAPDHLDGHQHVQQFDGLRELVLDVLTRRYDRRPWLRISSVGQPGLKAAVITRWGSRGWQRHLQATGWHGIAPLRGVYDFSGGREAYGQRMRAWLAQARRDGGMIMCHPAQGRDESDDIGLARAWEYEYLASEAFAHDLNEAGVQLDRGRALHLLP